MENELNSADCSISVEINTEEMPKVLSSNTESSTTVAENSLYAPTVHHNKEEDPEMFYIELSQRSDIIKKLQHENATILKERDEILEEYEDELQAIKAKNDEYKKENSELKQEIKILYKKIESQPENENFFSLQEKNSEMQSIILQNEKIIRELNETNLILVKSIPQYGDKAEELTLSDNSCENTLEQLMIEKNCLLKRIVEMDQRYFESVKEIEDMKNELVSMKLKYAESETQKEEIYWKTLDTNRKKKFRWNFWKFWKKNDN
jgi:chromosome segregation ATPase